MVYNDCIRAIIPWINRQLILKSLDLGGKPKLVASNQLQPVLGYRPRPNDLAISHGALPRRVKKADLDACMSVFNTNANPNESGRSLDSEVRLQMEGNMYYVAITKECQQRQLHLHAGQFLI